MNNYFKKYASLVGWIFGLLGASSLLSVLTKNNISSWYLDLNRSLLTPPNYVFGYVWTVLYTMIGIAGWIIWRAPETEEIHSIKKVFIIQLILNWCWTPLFFGLHLTGVALACLVGLVVTTALIILKTHKQLTYVTFLLLPYLCWLLLATHLNWYIWQFN